MAWATLTLAMCLGLSTAEGRESPYDCRAWMEMLDLESQIAEKAGQVSEAELAALKSRLAYYRYYLAEEPLPSTAASANRTLPEWTPASRPWALTVNAELREGLERRLRQHHGVELPAPLVDGVVVRINVSKQLRSSQPGLAQALERAGFHTPERRLLAAEILSNYQGEALVRIRATPQRFHALTAALKLDPQTALTKYHALLGSQGQAPADPAAMQVAATIRLIAEKRLNRDVEQVYSDLVRLTAGDAANDAVDFLDVLLRYLELTDPLYGVNDLVSLHQFVAGR